MRKTGLSVLFLLTLLLNAASQFSISSNHHYLLKNGQPFFWLGDTAWELFHRLNREEADQYLKRRSEQGFTVIQAVVLAELDGLNTPNANGDLPLQDDDPAKPNEKYFAMVDDIISKADAYHLTIALLPTWGDKVFKDKWGMGPEIFNEQNAAVFARWLAKRYKDKTNIIWILGGDRVPRNESDIAIWRAMGMAIMKETGGRAIISYHSQPNLTGSAAWFSKEPWFAFNIFQNGHCRDVDNYEKILDAWNSLPALPVIDAEPIYEDHPVCFNAKDLGISSAYDVRKYAYLDLFAGAFGHTYGCHDVWQMYSPKQKPVNGPHFYWYDALELPGVAQMLFVKNLLESYPLTDRIPDQSLIIENNNTASERIQATRGNDYLFVYTVAGKPFTVKMGKIEGKQLRAYWYNPRNGKTTDLAAVENTGSKKFSPPSVGYGQDWVLVLDNAERKYPKPGLS